MRDNEVVCTVNDMERLWAEVEFGFDYWFLSTTTHDLDS